MINSKEKLEVSRAIVEAICGNPNDDSKKPPKKTPRCLDPDQWPKDLMTLQQNYYKRWRHFYG